MRVIIGASAPTATFTNEVGIGSSSQLLFVIDVISLAEDKTHGYHPQTHQPSAIEDLQQGSTVVFVDSFTYLGSLITNDGSSSRDITSRLAKAASAMCRLSNPLFRKRRISIRTKINMYRALVVSVLLYGSEALATTLADRRRLDVFDMRCQRRLLHVFWQQHVSNQSIRECTKQPTASSLPMTTPPELVRTSPPHAILPPCTESL